MQSWYLCSYYIIINYIKVIKITFSFGRQSYFQFMFLILLRKFNTARILSYISFRILYDFTIDESYHLEQVSLLSTRPFQTFILV